MRLNCGCNQIKYKKWKKHNNTKAKKVSSWENNTTQLIQTKEVYFNENETQKSGFVKGNSKVEEIKINIII